MLVCLLVLVLALDITAALRIATVDATLISKCFDYKCLWCVMIAS